MQTVSFKTIQNRYPNEWVLLGNPKSEKGVVLGGVVLYHSTDKKEVCYLGKEKTAGFDRIRLVFTGQLTFLGLDFLKKRKFCLDIPNGEITIQPD